MPTDDLDTPRALWLASVDHGTKHDLFDDMSAFLGKHTGAIPANETPSTRALVFFTDLNTYYGYSDPNPTPMTAEELEAFIRKAKSAKLAKPEKSSECDK